MAGDDLTPELSRILQKISDKIRALEARNPTVGATNLNALDDVWIDVLSRSDMDVLTWVEANQDWETKPSQGGFPVTYDDGTYTYSIVVGTGAMTIKVIKDSDATHVVDIVLDVLNGDIDVLANKRDFNVTAGRDVNLSSGTNHDVNVGSQGTGNVNIGALGTGFLFLGARLAFVGLDQSAVGPVGSIVGKIPIYVSGSIVGYLPVYNTIT